MAYDKIKVLYIAGTGRSGSTILGDILGQIDGFFHVGEILNIWKRGLIVNGLCGCGVVFRECEAWQAVLNEAFGGKDQIDYREMSHLRRNLTHMYHVPLMLMPWGRQLLISRLKEYSNNLEKLYSAIRSSTGCKVIVDSSKSAPYLYVLGTIPTIELYVVHLIRDPRGVAFSWQRKKLRLDMSDRVYMRQYSSARSSWRWDTRNLAVGALSRRFPKRYLMLRYEDFIEKPQGAIRQILDWVQEDAPSLPFVSERAVELKRTHGIGGNPSRFQVGTVELRSDDKWKGEMRRLDKIVVTALTWPLLLRYGYLSGKGS